MSEKTIRETDRLLKMIAAKASTGLASAVDEVGKEIKDFTGKHVSWILKKGKY
jgi:hypothetical protein